MAWLFLDPEFLLQRKKIYISIFMCMWQPAPVLLPGKSHGWRSVVGYSPWVAKSQTGLSDFTSLHFIGIYRRRQWQPTPVFLPGESQGWWSLVGCRLWGRTESDTTEAT